MPCSRIDEITVPLGTLHNGFNALNRLQISRNIAGHAALRYRERKPYKLFAIIVAISAFVIELPIVALLSLFWYLSIYRPRISRPTRSFQPLNFLYIILHCSISIPFVQWLLLHSIWNNHELICGRYLQ
jgi:hypothetical protein